MNSQPMVSTVRHSLCAVVRSVVKQGEVGVGAAKTQLH